MKRACEVALLVVVVSVVVREEDVVSVDVCVEVLYNLQVRLEREARLRGRLAGCGCKRGS